MIPGSKGLNPHELAHRWVQTFRLNKYIVQVSCFMLYMSKLKM